MTREELLMIVIGAFVLIIGIIYLLQLRKTGSRKLWSFPLVVGLFIIGIILMVSPWIKVPVKMGELLDSKPDDQPSYLRGEELFSAGRKFSEDDYNKASSFYLKGVKLYRTELRGFDSTEVAMDYFNKSIEYFETTEAYTARGQLKVQLSDMRGALMDYNRAIDIDDKYGRAYFNRGTVHYIMGNNDLACADWEKARKLQVPNADQAIQQMCK